MKLVIKESRFEGFLYKYAEFRKEKRSSNGDLIFIGGAFQDIKASYKICRELSNYFNVYSLDLPGSGAADILPCTYDFSYLANVVNHFAELVNVNKFHIVGCSYGSPVAYRIAQLFPQKIGRIVFTGAMKSIPPENVDVLKKTIELAESGRIYEFDNLLTRMFFNYEKSNVIPKQHYIMKKFSNILKEMNLSMKLKYAENTKRLLKESLNLTPRIFSSTLIVTGEYDNFTTPAYCKKFSSMCENSITTFIKNSDHFFHAEQHKITIKLISQFLIGGDIRHIEGHSKYSSANNNQYAQVIASEFETS
ncbi:MAG: pimeloyl-ACP methyl ester carboxylesterase [Lentisphaeria bacterium]|jgi:pimeloyl-ACP methyl ester carboxylesterase